VQEKSHKSKVDSDTDGKDTFVLSGLYSVVEKQKKTSTKQGKLDHKDRKQLTRNELKQSVLFFIIHMCIKRLGHFSPLSPPPTLPPTPPPPSPPTPSIPSRKSVLEVCEKIEN
jgi:hypothetical protein